MNDTVERRRMPRSLVLAALLVVVTLVAACSATAGSSSSGILRVPNSGFTGAGQSRAGLDRPWSIGALNLCVTGGTVTVHRVALVRTRGPIKLLDWGVRRHHPGDSYTTPYLGMVQEKVTAEGFAHRPVTVTCGTPAGVALDQFAFEVALTGPGIAVSHALRLTYADGKSVVMPYGIVLCRHKCPLITTVCKRT